MAEDKNGKKNGDKKPRNVRKPFKRQPPLSDLDKQRIENARTSETIKKIEKTAKLKIIGIRSVN